MTKPAMKAKIADWKSLVEYLSIAGFSQNEEELEMSGYNKEVLNDLLESIHESLKANSEYLGVKVSSGFDPQAESSSSTAGGSLKSKNSQDYDPAHLEKLILEEKQHKRNLLKRDPPSRDLQVFDANFKGESRRDHMVEEEKKQVTEEEQWEDSMMNKGVLKMLRENQKNKKFQSKRAKELEKIRNQKVYSRTIIRVNFPDGFMLQGKFGALEKISELYDFVLENIFDKEREFYLYLSPPKQILSDQK